MKQFITAMRWKWNGERWAGPLIEADTIRDARALMRYSPYRVVGELVQSQGPGGQVERQVITDEDTHATVH